MGAGVSHGQAAGRGLSAGRRPDPACAAGRARGMAGEDFAFEVGAGRIHPLQTCLIGGARWPEPAFPRLPTYGVRLTF